MEEMEDAQKVLSENSKARNDLEDLNLDGNNNKIYRTEI
jgi:hypothetical protein